ncbi:MAG: hypothetical protein HKM87_04545 [Ignavibacteriaceae bacterium]|nr:hypothetical protein [Ignavibacteriaceae bacterium]
MEWQEIIGYTGSALIAISLMMKNIFRLRRVNLIGATTFAIYGLLVQAYPVLILNSFVAIVDVYYLVGMYMQKDAFHLMPVLDHNHLYLNEFLDFHKNDIDKFSPEFNMDKTANASCYFVLRNLVPVGIFIYKNTNPGEANILLDYAIPDYRDMKNAEYLYYTESKFLKEKGIKNLITESSVKEHRKYLKKLGFIESKTEKNIFRKKL